MREICAADAGTAPCGRHDVGGRGGPFRPPHPPALAHRALTAANVGNSDLCLLKGGVRQHGLAVRVADHIDVVDAALEALVAGDGRTGIRSNKLRKLKIA